MDKCQHNLKENSQTHSVYCEKLQQWVSSNYCNLCLNREAASSTKTTNENFSFYLYYVTNLLTNLLSYSHLTKNQNTPKRLPTVPLSLEKFLLRCSV